jgi:hypothetical protein
MRHLLGLNMILSRFEIDDLGSKSRLRGAALNWRALLFGGARKVYLPIFSFLERDDLQK